MTNEPAQQFSDELSARPPAARSGGLRRENEDLRARLEEAEETLRAIRQGEVDALVVEGPSGEQQVFTLQGAETPYRVLVEEMNEGALLLGADGIILYANARFAQLAGRPLEEIVGADWTGLFAPADQQRLKAMLGVDAAAGVRQETTLQTPGSTRPVDVSLASMRRNGLEGFSVVVTDLAERKAAEEALRASNAKLREMVAELEHFSYSIGHDMRAPLRAMKSFAVILEESCDPSIPAPNRDLIRRISAAATRLDHLIQGSLNYARVVKEELSVEQVDLGKLLAGLLESYPDLLPQKADIRVEGQLPVVLGNEAAITQVFSNLLGNAVKFVAPGVRPVIRIRAEESDTRAQVWVEDNGLGIASESQCRIFEMFQRVHKGYEGTGMGLAIVRKVIERMGGRVGVESEVGKGSSFWVEFRVPMVPPGR